MAHKEKHVCKFIFLPTYGMWSSFVKSFIQKEKLFPLLALSMKPSRIVESRCSQLYFYATQVTTNSGVFFVSIFLRFAVFSTKCHKFLRKQLKTQFNHSYLSVLIFLSHVPDIFMDMTIIYLNKPASVQRAIKTMNKVVAYPNM